MIIFNLLRQRRRKSIFTWKHISKVKTDDTTSWHQGVRDGIGLYSHRNILPKSEFYRFLWLSRRQPNRWLIRIYYNWIINVFLLEMVMFNLMQQCLRKTFFSWKHISNIKTDDTTSWHQGVRSGRKSATFSIESQFSNQ